MSTSGILVFKTIENENIILNLENTEILNVELLKDDVIIYKHNDGGQIAELLYYFLQDDAIRRNDATSLTAWGLYELMTYEGHLSRYKDDKRQYYAEAGLKYDISFIDFLFLVINGEKVLIYEYGKLRRVIDKIEYDELLYIH